MGTMIMARQVKAGDRIRPYPGPAAEVLCSVPERQSAGSGSFTLWHIEYYAEGEPTRRMLVEPDALVEVLP